MSKPSVLSVDLASVGSLGFERHVDVAVRLHIPRSQTVAASRALGALIADIDGFAARVAGLTVTSQRTELTLAISLGTTDQIRSNDETSLRAVRSLHGVVEEMSAYAPTLVAIPSPGSAEALCAARLVEGEDLFAWLTASV